MTVPEKKPKYLSKEQIAQLLESTKDKSIYHYILISVNTGARLSEVANLKWNNVNFHQKQILVEGKGAKERYIPMPNNLVEYLKGLKKNGNYVAPGMRSKNRVSRQFRFYADKLGLDDYTFHNLRDTYASRLVQNEMPLTVIKDLLGHDNIKTTLIYARIAPENKIRAIKIMDEMLS